MAPVGTGGSLLRPARSGLRIRRLLLEQHHGRPLLAPVSPRRDPVDARRSVSAGVPVSWAGMTPARARHLDRIGGCARFDSAGTSRGAFRPSRAHRTLLARNPLHELPLRSR